jgi:hypothetical protein
MRGDWGGTIGDERKGRLAIDCWKYGYLSCQCQRVMPLKKGACNYFAKNIDKIATVS